MDSTYASGLDEPARLRATRFGSLPVEREPGADPNDLAGRRRVEYRGRARIDPSPKASRARRHAGLELILVTGGRPHGDGPAALDSAMGTELTRRSR